MVIVQQAAAIVVRGTAAFPEVLIVRARKNPSDWIFPKGHIEPGETPAQAAVRELAEEGGVLGEAEDFLGVSILRAGAHELEISYFKVKYTGDGAVTETRERRWVTFDVARALLTYEDARRYVGIVERIVRAASS